ncbi:MAG: phosphate ABC transporter permease subunit PstC [Thermoanaerobaculia bacterium]
MRSPRRIDLLRLMATALTLLTLVTVAGIVLFLAVGSVAVFRHEGWAFFSKNHWYYRKEAFQAAAMLYGTAVVSSIAIVLATPLAFATAVVSAEMLSERPRLALKLLIELLAGVPSVIYGLLGVLFLRNWMSSLFLRLRWDADSGDTLLTAGVLLAVMILPTLMTLFDDAFRSVAARDRDAARGLGLTRAETLGSIVLPQAMPGLLSAMLLALGRALGETIAVFLVVGRADNRLPKLGTIAHSLVDAGQTITSKLGGAETNIAVGDPLHTSALLALALTLFATVIGITLLASLLRTRMRMGAIA